jgi:hypothetical protein
MEMADIVVGINKCDFLGGKVAQGWQWRGVILGFRCYFGGLEVFEESKNTCSFRGLHVQAWSPGVNNLTYIH